MSINTKSKRFSASFGKILTAMALLITVAVSAISPLTGTQDQVQAANSWEYRSIDTQIISKCWNNVSVESIDKQVSMLKDLGVNYIAIGTPYDRPEEMKKWTDSIHKAGLKVWFRSHWLAWEGDEGQPKNMGTAEYLQKTHQFIVDHPDFFKAGDSFTVNVEAENAGIGEGKPFADWASYRKFLSDQIDIANSAFAQIGLDNQIKTNWLSTNGWITENAIDQALADKMGLITVDHYPPQGSGSSLVSIDEMAKNMSADLDRFYNKWKKPIMIGEWGYHLDTDVSDEQQRQAVEAIYKVFASKPYIKGVNYWDHMGNNTRIINDQGGVPTTLRPAAQIIKDYYNGSIETPPPAGNNPTPTTPPANPSAPDQSGSQNGAIADFQTGLNGFDNGEIVNGSLKLTNPANGSTGASKIIDKFKLAGYKYLEFDIDLQGNKLLSGDASAIYFDQGGWKWTTLTKYVENGKNGFQHISIPLSDFNLDQNIAAARLGFRFWNDHTASYNLDNIKLTNGSAANPAPTNPPAEPYIKKKILANFESGYAGWYGGRAIAGFESKRALRITNPQNGSFGSKYLMNGKTIGDFNYIEMDINLHGNKLIAGDASAIYFDQNGLKWTTLYGYVENNKDGWQHVRIPLSAFSGLDKNAGITALGFRFWNYNQGSYDIDNIILS